MGDLSELGMVNLRSIGEIATVSESAFPEDMLLEGEWADLNPSLVDPVQSTAALVSLSC